MTRNVPHQNSFDIAKKLEKWQTFILIMSTVFTIGSITLNSMYKSQPEVWIDTWISIANASSSLFAAMFITIDILINDKFYSGGKEKRIDLIDHAFDTNFSGEKSTGYFNAQGVPIGIYKLAVLGFENSLFTSTVAKKMTFNKWAITFVISALFIVSACIGNKELVNNLLQIAATGVLIQQAVRLQQFSNRMKRLHDDFKVLFTNLKGAQNKSKQEGEMTKNVLNYEATHAWGGILLNSKIFDKINPTLSAKWEQMKQDYNI